MFLQLCFVDLGTPYNYLIIAAIKREVKLANLKKAVLESAPQLVLKIIIYLLCLTDFKAAVAYESKLWKMNSKMKDDPDISMLLFFFSLLGAIGNFLCLSYASHQLFYVQRDGAHSDPDPSFKLSVLLFPLFMFYTGIYGFMWSQIFFAIEWYGFFMLGGILLTSLVLTKLLLKVEEKCFKSDMKQYETVNVSYAAMSSWFAPYVVWSERFVINVLQLVINLVLTAAVPFACLVISILVEPDVEEAEKWDYVYFILKPAFASLAPCVILFVFRSHHNLYKLNQLLRLCRMKPVVHRSMVYDFLDKPTNPSGDLKYVKDVAIGIISYGM